MAQFPLNTPDSHSSSSPSTPQIPFHASNPSPAAMSPSELENDTKIPLPLRPSPSSSTHRPITANSVCSTSSNSSSSSSASSYTSSNPTSQDSGSDVPDKHSSTTLLTSSQAGIPNPQSPNVDSGLLPRPVSPFRAPRPPLRQHSSRSFLSQPTAMRSYMIPLNDTTSYPPPDPPVILPTENNTITSPSSFRSQAPYFPFLSHAPSPENSWIEVETLQHEYKLHVRLPGFTQEGITLATRRRRILHVVADKWENGGGKWLLYQGKVSNSSMRSFITGHFERRVSFGYDADLAHVRADFDGLMLCIMVPRRISPFTIARSSPAAVGRSTPS